LSGAAGMPMVIHPPSPVAKAAARKPIDR
jgi:hypothetical protein